MLEQWRALCNFDCKWQNNTASARKHSASISSCTNLLNCFVLVLHFQKVNKRLWVAFKLGYHSSEQIWVSGWSKNANFCGRQFSPKVGFNIYLRGKSLLIRDQMGSAWKNIDKCTNSWGSDTEFSFDRWHKIMQIFRDKESRFNHMGSHSDSFPPLSEY